tara:strand:- start:566 stop:1651 length:1086 start_codon:yes stop_codon:yes gene_type:complete
MNKILMISSTAKVGGGPKNMFSLGQNLMNDFDIFYAIPYEESFSSLIPRSNILFISERKIFLKDIFALAKFINNNSIDIIHAHGKGASVLGRILVLFWKKKLVYTYHGIHLECHTKIIQLLYLIFENITGLLDNYKVFVSCSEMLYAKKVKILFRNNFRIINNGVENRPLSKAARKDILKSDLAKNFKIVSVSRFVKQKNILEIVKIALLIPQINFLIIGDGPEFNNLSDFIIANNIRNVTLTGFKKNVFPHLQNSDVFLSTSLYEGLPISLLEAMSVGLPIIATNVTGNKDAVEHGISGYLYNLGEIYQAKEYILNLINNKDLRKKMSIESQKRQRDYFSTNTMINEYKILYKDILKKTT